MEYVIGPTTEEYYENLIKLTDHVKWNGVDDLNFTLSLPFLAPYQ